LIAFQQNAFEGFDMATITDVVTQISTALATAQGVAGVPTDAAQLATLTAAVAAANTALTAATATVATDSAEIVKIKADLVVIQTDLAKAVADAP
jgi:hypothetical protein